MPSRLPYHVPFLNKILQVRTCGGSAGGTGGDNDKEGGGQVVRAGREAGRGGGTCREPEEGQGGVGARCGPQLVSGHRRWRSASP